jgi:cell division protein FtsL
MNLFIDTLISASIVSLALLICVLASAIYEKWCERKAK